MIRLLLALLIAVAPPAFAQEKKATEKKAAEKKAAKKKPPAAAKKRDLTEDWNRFNSGAKKDLDAIDKKKAKK